MGQLAAQDLRAAHEFTLEVLAARSLTELRSATLPGLRRLVPCDSIGYNEVDLSAGTAVGITDPTELASPELSAAFAQVSGQHPLIAQQAAGDPRTQALSDHLSERAFHRLELYHDYYKRIEAEDQLAFGVAGQPVVAFALCRRRRNFTQRDREMLELVRPHLAEAYRHARKRELELAFLDAVDDELERLGVGLILLDPAGRVEHERGAAAQLLEAYRVTQADAARCRDQLVIEAGRGRLRIRRGGGPDEYGWQTLVLEERRAELPSLESLCELGLTRRQAEVLRLLAAGKGSAAIASELGVSSDTVRKHLENIYARLGVHSRTQAVAQVRLG